MACKGICFRHKLQKPFPHFYRYINGQKRCRKCDVFLDWKGGLWCPCCGSKLRLIPRSRVSKERLRMAKKVF